MSSGTDPALAEVKGNVVWFCWLLWIIVSSQDFSFHPHALRMARWITNHHSSLTWPCLLYEHGKQRFVYDHLAPLADIKVGITWERSCSWGRYPTGLWPEFGVFLIFAIFQKWSIMTCFIMMPMTRTSNFYTENRHRKWDADVYSSPVLLLKIISSMLLRPWTLMCLIQKPQWDDSVGFHFDKGS